MPKKFIWFSLGLGGVFATTTVVLLAVFILKAWWGLPFNVLGWNDPPPQPIAFPHTHHVAVDGIDCAFCHRNVLEGYSASVPAVELCVFCHKTIQGDKAPPEIQKVIDHYENNIPINWEKVHRLPDHVQFSHEPHVRFLTETRGLELEAACATCHGDIRDMVEVEQVRRLKMGDCVDCHRNNEHLTENTGLTDCTTCHY